MRLKKLIAFFVLFHSTWLCEAQRSDSIFRPQEIILFSDDFSECRLGAFPQKWHVDCSSCDHLNFKSTSSNCTVAHWGDTSGIRLTPSNSRGDWIMPTMALTDYLPDSFTLEYDFMLETRNASCNLYFIYCDNCLCEVFYLYNKGNYKFVLSFGGYRGVQSDGEEKDKYVEGEQLIHQGRDSATWHHFALSYYKGLINGYVDGRHLMRVQASRLNPKKFQLNCNHGNGSVRYANVRLATGNYISQQKNEDFKRLLTEKKMVTHSILFDVNSAEIKPESLSFIQKFGLFLKSNPRLKLEIDGHTDNDGLDDFNMQLSQKRALQVKRQLMDLGVSGARLTTKGFGASRPIADNRTAEGKAENRRVEFISK